MKSAKFLLGQTVATPGVLGSVDHSEIDSFLRRHETGDWGDVDGEDREENERALKVGNRLMSVYVSSTGVKVWVITEWDRSVTTCLLPSEY